MEGWTRRKINGRYYNCRDIGCPNFTGAKQNRERIAGGYALHYWKLLEQALEENTRDEDIPDEFKRVFE